MLNQTQVLVLSTKLMDYCVPMDIFCLTINKLLLKLSINYVEAAQSILDMNNSVKRGKKQISCICFLPKAEN